MSGEKLRFVSVRVNLKISTSGEFIALATIITELSLIASATSDFW
jgi:hypothetical protein